MERNKKARLFILLSAAGLVVSILLGLCLGTSNIRPSDLIATLTAGEADDFYTGSSLRSVCRELQPPFLQEAPFRYPVRSFSPC